MTIPFNGLPLDQRAPFFYAEFDNSMANTATATQRTLLIGQMLDTVSSGLADSIPQHVSTDHAVAGLCGRGSMLHNMMTAYLANDISAEIWILPLAEAAKSMTFATARLQVVSPASATGVVSLYIAGQRVQLTIVADDDLPAITMALADVINRKNSLPVMAECRDKDTVVLTAKNRGVLGNSIDIRLNYQGPAGGEQTPDGLELNITPMTGGVGSPDLTHALGNLQDRTFDFIVNPYTDTPSLDALKAFLSDTTGRWAYNQQLYGHAFGALAGTCGTLSAAGEQRNNQHETLLGVHGSPSPVYLWAAALTGAIATSLRNDPGRPLQTLTVNGVLPPPLESRFMLTERNNLLHSGISTFTVADDGAVQVENVITTWQKNKSGDPDNSYLQVETLFTLMYVVRYLRSQITSKFGRMKLANNGTRFAPGSAMVTPDTLKSELIAQYRTLEYNGCVQDSATFARSLQVERNSHNPNRIDVLWTGTLISQLRIFALLNQFRLQPAE